MKYLKDNLHIILASLIIVGVFVVLYFIRHISPSFAEYLGNLSVDVGVLVLIIFAYEGIKYSINKNHGRALMTKEQAEKIINLYGGAIAQNENAFKCLSTLPCSKGKIRYAYFKFISCYIDDYGSMPEDITENLVTTYSLLDAFVPDEEAKQLNQRQGLIKNHKLDKTNPEDKKLIDEYFFLVTNALANMKYREELHEFIGNCYADKNK
ncbi:MAG: hypothetical protein WC500_06690 [Candidatus Margulisiibacteriota bacterium]